MKNWKKLSEHIAFNGYRKVIVRKFQMPNGKEESFDVIGNNDFVTIAAFTKNNEAILVNQFRAGAERVLTSFPEGQIDDGEEIEIAARRELLEETGYQADEIIFLKTIHQAYFTQKQHIVLATNCVKISEQDLDESEFIEVFKLSLAELRIFLKNKNDERMNHNVAAAYLALDYLNHL